MADQQSIRCFLGVPVPSTFAARLPPLLAQALTAHTGDAPRTVADANLHLTLAFLGDQPEQQLQALFADLPPLLSAVPAFSVQAQTISAFPDAMSSIVALEFPPVASLLLLKQLLDSALAQRGVETEHRPLRPHITLARGKRGEHLMLAPVNDAGNLVLDVNQVCLFESVRDVAGSQYHVRWCIPLQRA